MIRLNISGSGKINTGFVLIKCMTDSFLAPGRKDYRIFQEKHIALLLEPVYPLSLNVLFSHLKMKKCFVK